MLFFESQIYWSLFYHEFFRYNLLFFFSDMKFVYPTDFEIIDLDNPKHKSSEISRKSFDLGVLVSSNHSIFDISKL